MAIRAVLALWLVLAGCGRLRFDPMAANDANDLPSRPRCAVLDGAWTLEPPTRIAELSTPTADREIYLSADGLTAYVANSFAASTYQSYRAKRLSTDESWGPPVEQAWANVVGYETTRVAVTADDLEAFVSADRMGGSTGQDLWSASRSSPGIDFGALVLLGSLSSAGAEYDPFPSDDARHLYYMQRAATTSIGVLMVAERAARGDPFAPPVPIPGVPAGDDNDNPAVTPDERMLLFTSKRTGGAGGDDIWFAVRADPSEPFGLAQPLPVINSSTDDTEAHPWGCELYFSSRITGDLDIYRSRFVAI